MFKGGAQADGRGCRGVRCGGGVDSCLQECVPRGVSGGSDFYGRPSPPRSCCPGECLCRNDGDSEEGILLVIVLAGPLSHCFFLFFFPPPDTHETLPFVFARSALHPPQSVSSNHRNKSLACGNKCDVFRKARLFGCVIGITPLE